MRLKAKPVRPTRKTIRLRLDVYDETVASLLLWCKESGISPNEANLHHYDNCVFIEGTRQETDAEFQKRLDAYEKALAAWNEWYATNRTAIDEELRVRKEAVQKRADKQRANTVSRLKRELAKLCEPVDAE